MIGCVAARVVTAAVLTGFAASCTAGTPPQGVITGSVWPCTGAVIIPGKGVPVPVRIERSGRVVETHAFPAPGRFRISIAPGTYLVAPKGEVPVTVRVIAGRTVRARLMPTRFCNSLQ
jgi:hypothetical protein